MRDALSTLERIGTPRALVIGDVMLDRYIWGTARRLSPEAPVPVLRRERCESRLGGAAAVAYLLRSLDAQVTLCGVIGDDHDGQILRGLLDGSAIDHSLVIAEANRPTTCKERIVGQLGNRCPHQIVRVDREVLRRISNEAENHLLVSIRERLPDHDVVLVSDYRKGACSRRLLAAVISAALKQGVPAMVDPARGVDYARYRKASLVKPNRTEAQIASGVTIRRPEDALTAGRLLCQQSHATSVLITLDAEGMALVPAGGKGQLIATRPRVVHDATGAGDMVLAMLGVCCAGGIALHEAACLANIAAGLEVEKFGIAPISRDEIRAALLPLPPGEGRGEGELNRSPAPRLGRPRAETVSLDKLLSRLEELRRDHKTIVFTNGCFDLLHVGHVRCLEEAASLGDVLVVGINSDESVRRLKGETRPLIGAEQRAELLSAIACVDFVVVFDSTTPHELLRAIQPNVLVKGGSTNGDCVVGREIVEAYGGTVHVVPVTATISTTTLVAKLRESAAREVPVQRPGDTTPAPVGPVPLATNGHADLCVHLGRKTGFRHCDNCQGNVRKKVFACDHPNHTETTLADCKNCPDYAARSRAAEPPRRQQAMAAAKHLPANANGENATAATAVDAMRAPSYADRVMADAGFVAIGPPSGGRVGRPMKPPRGAASASHQLILQSYQSPGDIVMLTAAVRDLHLAQPGRFQTDVRTSVPALWENNPYVTPLDATAHGVKTVEMHYDLINQCNTLPYHFVHGYVQHLERQLGVRIPVTRFHGDVHLAPEEKQWMSQVEELGFGDEFWIVMAGGKHDFTAKWWNPASYQKVVDHFRGRIQFVQCGEEGHFHPPLKGVINLVGKTDARQFIRLMYHAVGVLCPVTYAMHLAAAVETKPGRPPHRACVVVGGGREPPHWEAYPHHQYISTVGALKCCEQGGCWRSRCQTVGDGDAKDQEGVLCERPVQVSQELRIPQCMEMITAEDVIRRIELYYEGETLAYLDEQKRPD